ncbi:hypothetical protein KIN20_023393 [Parelaphostrongylus tenuis]|uniref:Uncharacterized protein n=1 Tax=Parelaphostrongylus tenuis TaxID=148309 RepID=A0AAD5QSX7_PARTN|nr:hypothetical protein KIN20_023393 [Parelaphostrongylus tenuis]
MEHLERVIYRVASHAMCDTILANYSSSCYLPKQRLKHYVQCHIRIEKLMPQYLISVMGLETSQLFEEEFMTIMFHQPRAVECTTPCLNIASSP